MALLQLSLGFFIPLVCIFFIELSARRRFVRSLARPGAAADLLLSSRFSCALIVAQAGWGLFMLCHAAVFGQL
jgi:hypothetical protein